MDLREILREVPDFPKPGINFIDITPILSNPDAFATAVDGLCRALNLNPSEDSEEGSND